MQKKLFYWELAGFLFVLAVGTLLHFTYDWSGKNPLVGAFSAVNESIWEHMKMLFIPLFLFSLVQLWFVGKPNFLAVRGLTALIGTALIPVLFYTYTGILGRNVIWVDMVIFVLAAAAAFALDFRWLSRGNFGAGWQQLAGFLLLLGLLVLFVLFTYRTPQLPLFRDPVTGQFGLSS